MITGFKGTWLVGSPTLRHHPAKVGGHWCGKYADIRFFICHLSNYIIQITILRSKIIKICLKLLKDVQCVHMHKSYSYYNL